MFKLSTRHMRPCGWDRVSVAEVLGLIQAWLGLARCNLHRPIVPKWRGAKSCWLTFASFCSSCCLLGWDFNRTAPHVSVGGVSYPVGGVTALGLYPRQLHKVSHSNIAIIKRKNLSKRGMVYIATVSYLEIIRKLNNVILLQTIKALRQYQIWYQL